jgi:1-acyl-sn-glycerol-3-phosphate acyltransferase
MAEPFYRLGEWIVPPVVAMQGTKFTFHGLENIPERGGALLAQKHTSCLDWLPRCSRCVNGAGGCIS